MWKFSLRTARIALVALAVGACSPDLPPPGVCAQAEVVARVVERSGHAGERTVFEPGSVGQVPSGPGRVNCALRVRTLVYDTVRVGAAPTLTRREVRYVLELRNNALFLSE